MIQITTELIDPGSLLQEFTDSSAGSGAIVSFTGLVRDFAGKEEVKQLHLQAYSPMTEDGIFQAAHLASERWKLQNSHITHRIGNMKPGEVIVFVATASAHRRSAFEAADFLVDYLKTEAVFWKRETTSTGAHWIEPRQADYSDAQRWKIMET